MNAVVLGPKYKREPMPAQIDHHRFIALLKVRFPEVAASIDDCSKGILHCEMGTFAQATQTAIDSKDVDAVRDYFKFADEILANATQDVENAINVSYLENLRFEGPKAKGIKARQLLPPRLEKALIELEAYLAKLFGGNGRNRASVRT